MGEEELIEVLRHGVPAFGLHEDNSTELFDIEAANEVMTEAADRIESQSARIAQLEAELAAERDGCTDDDAALWLEIGADAIERGEHHD